MAAFGANEWLVDQMYERYQQDPKSVDPAWLGFFKNHSPDAPSPNGGSDPAVATREPAPTQSAAPAPTAPPTPAPSTASNGAALATPPTPTKTNPATDVQPRPDAHRVAPTRTPKEPPPPVLGEASDAPAHTVLRGAPARTVQNMDAKLRGQP